MRGILRVCDHKDPLLMLLRRTEELADSTDLNHGNDSCESGKPLVRRVLSAATRAGTRHAARHRGLTRDIDLHRDGRERPVPGPEYALDPRRCSVCVVIDADMDSVIRRWAKFEPLRQEDGPAKPR